MCRTRSDQWRSCLRAQVFRLEASEPCLLFEICCGPGIKRTMRVKREAAQSRRRPTTNPPRLPAPLPPFGKPPSAFSDLNLSNGSSHQLGEVNCG